MSRWIYVPSRIRNLHKSFKLQYSGSPVITPKPKFVILPTVKLFDKTNLNPKIFLITTALSGLQLVLWSYLSYSALEDLDLLTLKKKVKNGKNLEDPETLKNSSLSGTPLETDVAADMSPLETGAAPPITDLTDKWFASPKWHIVLSLLSLGAGTVFVAVAITYPLRMVRSITYVRATQALQIVTYSPWGASRTIEVPLIDIICKSVESKRAPNDAIILGINNYFLNFLLNPNNASIHPMLRSLVLSRQKLS